MRDRLVELLKQANQICAKKFREETKAVLKQKGCFNSRTDRAENFNEITADYLIANGVIVPPCKVGDTVYVDSDTWGYDYLYFESKFIYSKYFLVGEIVSVVRTKKQLLMKIRVSNSIHTRYKHRRYTVNAIGKTVFITKEEAEKALEGGNEKCY